MYAMDRYKIIWKSYRTFRSFSIHLFFGICWVVQPLLNSYFCQNHYIHIVNIVKTIMWLFWDWQIRDGCQPIYRFSDLLYICTLIDQYIFVNYFAVITTIPPQTCTDNTCLNGGLCLDINGQAFCSCTNTGFDGDRCQNSLAGDCSSTNCLNNGKTNWCLDI